MQQNIIADLSEDVRFAANQSLVLALTWVILNVYNGHNAVPLTIAEYANDRRSTWLHRDLIQALLVRLARRYSRYQRFQLESERLYELTGRNASVDTIYSTEAAIWLVDTMESYRALEEDLLSPNSSYKRNGYFTLVYTGNEPNPLENIELICNRFFFMYITNVNVLLQLKNSTFAYTYFPFRPHKCHSSQPRLHISFRGIQDQGEFHTQKKYFPSKVRNMHGCELSVATWHFPPFVMLDRNATTNAVTRIHGMEGLLLAHLAAAMNFSLRIAEPTVHDRGDVYKNGTVTGLTKVVVDGEANFTILFYMVEKKRSQYMLASISYMSFPLAIVIPRGRMLSPMERLMRPFNYVIWCCLGSSIVLAILVIYALKLLGRPHIMIFVFGAHNHFPISSLWNTLYGGSIHYNLQRNFARYLLMLWLIYTFVLRTAYTGQLFLLLQDARAFTTLQTLQEIVDKNYTINTVPVLAELLDGVTKKPTLLFVTGDHNTVPMVMKRISAPNAKEAMTLIEPVLHWYNSKQKSDEQRVAMLPEKMVNAPLTMYMRHHSYVHGRIDELLLDMLAAGMVNKFERQYIDAFNTNFRSNTEPTILSLRLLLGIFTVYLVLLALCALVFLLELLAQYSPLIKCAIDFFNY